MASIVHRNNRFLVVHYEHDISGKNKQKWETYRTLADAKRRKAEIEHRQELGALDVPTCKTVNDLLKEYGHCPFFPAIRALSKIIFRRL